LKPATLHAAARFEVQSFKGYVKNTLQGFFDVLTPEGLVIHGCSLHQKDRSRWVGMPAKQLRKADGSTAWIPIIEFESREAADEFRDNVLDALDRFHGGAA
jgi:DNA-binding cell septation regulator SpoVG